MSSYRQHLYHLVFRTKDSLPTIKQDDVNELYAYITGIVKHKNSHLYRINGVENHLHILTDMHPSIAPADFMREVRAAKGLLLSHPRLAPGVIHIWLFQSPNCNLIGYYVSVLNSDFCVSHLLPPKTPDLNNKICNRYKKYFFSSSLI
jgi:REP element-mobilizing transposase RayT